MQPQIRNKIKVVAIVNKFLENDMKEIGVLILAAGESKRMGKSKQLLSWGSNNFLDHTINQASSLNSKICVVLGANSKKIANNIKNNTKIIVNQNWKKGIGSSLSYGTKIFGKDKEALLILLCDQPLISSDFLNLMLKKYNSNCDKIIATSYNKRAGVPAIFPKKYFSDLELLNKDFGASKFMLNEKSNTILIDPMGKNIDVDTQEQYEALIS